MTARNHLSGRWPLAVALLLLTGCGADRVPLAQVSGWVRAGGSERSVNRTDVPGLSGLVVAFGPADGVDFPTVVWVLFEPGVGKQVVQLVARYD